MSNEAITITFTHLPMDIPPGEVVERLTSMVIEHQHEIAGESQPRETIEAAARAWVCLTAVANSLDGNVRLPLALTMMAHGIAAPAQPPPRPEPHEVTPREFHENLAAATGAHRAGWQQTPTSTPQPPDPHD